MFFTRNVVKAAAPIAQLSRTYATAATAKAVPVPIALHGIEGRYATALYTAAIKKNSLEKVENDLKTVGQVLSTQQKFKTALEDPLVNKKDKKALVNSGLGAAKFNEITKNFFDVLAENGRLDQTTKVLAAFQQLMAAHRREVSVTVISAKTLDSKTSSTLEGILLRSNLIEKGSKVVVNNKVDSNILGGLIIDFGDKTIDLSVASKINKLNRLLTEAI
ncbi:F-type H+-transporting ATPase oligomycin sensitivity conferral protein [Fimicolochytrium jonesii]|uniref:F-type H+-transporting ATPase oligomycin sensitivity conferral protein n=1 Tax=Fimicolochytrium jonesii TaxID=1396493 RepID=UPI0022FE8532|nr:F-type H+-transporting ATPase oligomycin sensitivity conferral protein [Fimicolochytrium jonesii]KAI8820584.1 F-type H+-transporting ATPase oligomycin sensitivity conferral protein [Fimicolochytrium jonesii]